MQLRNIIVRLNHPTGKLSHQNIKDAVRSTGMKLDQQVGSHQPQPWVTDTNCRVTRSALITNTPSGVCCFPRRVQEEITLIRALDPLKKGVIPSYRLIKKLEGPMR